MAKIGDLWVRLGLKKGEFDKGMSEAESKTKSFGSNVSSSMKKAAGAFLTVSAAVKVIGDSIKTLATFERANSTLASVLGTTIGNIKALTESAKELGRVTEFTASEVTQLQTELARLGFAEGDILNMQGSVLKFAAAVGTDLARAATFAGASIRAFGLDTKDTSDLLDVMANSTTKSALSFAKLETSLGIVFPIANSFGLSVKDTIAMLGALNNVLPDASMAATAFRNILMNLADDNGALAKGLGHTARTFPELVAAFKELSERGVDLNEVLQMSDKRSASALASFIQNTNELVRMRQALEGSTGAVNEMYDTMTNNLIGSVRQLKSAWEGLVLTWQNSTGPMKSVVDWMTNMVNKITDFKEAAQTGGMSRKDKEATAQLWQRFKAVGDTQGKEEMVKYYDKWLKDAKAASDAAMDKWLAYKSRKNKKARDAAGSDYQNAYELRNRVMGYDPTPNAVSIPTEPENNTSIPTVSSSAAATAKDDGLLDYLDRKVNMAKAYWDLIEETEKRIEDGYKELDNITMPDIEFEIDTSGLEKFLEEYEEGVRRAQELTGMFAQAVTGGFTDACQEVMNQLMGLSESNYGAVLQALLEPLADMVVRAGELIMAYGIASLAFAEAISNPLTGWAAIAAGAALIAAGAAAKAGLAALASNGSSTGAATSSSGGSYGTSSQNIESEMTIYVTGRISGNDILISGEKTKTAWAR